MRARFAFSPRQWTILQIGALVLGTLFIVTTRVHPAQDARESGAVVQASDIPAPQPDHPAPDFVLPSLDGTSITLSELHGQVVLINVWATWCPPCRAEMPAIQAAYDQYRDRGFTVLAVNSREVRDTVTQFTHQHALTFPVLLDTEGKMGAAYRANVLPSSFFVDRRGIIRVVYRGPLPASVIEGTVTQLLREGS